MAIKFLINAVDSEATGCQRIIYPVQALVREGFSFEAVNTADIRSQLRKADLVLLQCLIGPEQHDLIDYIHRQNKKVVVDYDDDFSSLPTNLIERIGYSQKQISENWKKYLRSADLITVPCEELAKRVKNFTDKPVKVLPNLIRKEDFETTRDYDPFVDTDEIRIIYSCSESHLKDFISYGSILKKIGERHKNVRIISHGGLNFGYYFPKYKGKSRHYPKISYNSYFKFLRQVNPHIFIAPLRSTPHNIARSNLKYLQAGVAKAAFVGSHLSPYHNLPETSAITPKFDLTWWWHLRKLIKNPDLAKKMGLAASKDILNSYILENHIDLWKDAYNEIV